MMDGWDWIWGTLMMVVFWGGLAAVVVVGVRAFGGNPRRASGETETPVQRRSLTRASPEVRYPKRSSRIGGGCSDSGVK